MWPQPGLLFFVLWLSAEARTSSAATAAKRSGRRRSCLSLPKAGGRGGILLCSVHYCRICSAGRANDLPVRDARRSKARIQDMCVGNVESLLAFLNLNSTSPQKILSPDDDRARYRALWQPGDRTAMSTLRFFFLTACVLALVEFPTGRPHQEHDSSDKKRLWASQGILVMHVHVTFAIRMRLRH